jgi:hypothetical protein
VKYGLVEADSIQPVSGSAYRQYLAMQSTAHNECQDSVCYYMSHFEYTCYVNMCLITNRYIANSSSMCLDTVRYHFS